MREEEEGEVVSSRRKSLVKEFKWDDDKKQGGWGGLEARM